MSRSVPSGPPLLLLLCACSVQQTLYPAPPVPVPSPPPAPFEEVQLRTRVGELAWSWHYRHPETADSTPAAVFFHGNGENLETMRWVGLFERLGRLGIPFLAVDYPGYGRSGGRPTEKGILATGAEALSWLEREYPENPKVLLGWSLGAAVAIQIAAEGPQRLDGLVAMSPWTSLAEAARVHFPGWLVRLLLRESYDSLTVAPRVRSPALVLHGTRDHLVPVTLGRRVARALGSDCRWVEVREAGHNDLLERVEVWREIEDFLGAVGGRRSAASRVVD